MTALLDTNVLVRLFTDDPRPQAAAARRLLTSGERLLVPDLVLAELMYVLDSVYGRARPEVAVAARAVVAHPTIESEDPAMLLRAIDVYESHRLDFADAYLVAVAERSGVGRVASFDRGLDRPGTIERIEPT